MRTHKLRAGLLFWLFLIISGVSLVSIASRSSRGYQIKEEKDKGTENYQGPIVDDETSPKISSLTDPKRQAVEKARFNRYNHRAPEPLGDFASVVFEISTHWNIDLPPLPISESDLIVLGKVVAAQAHLSSDRAGVYSEFTINVEKTFKNTDLPIGDSLTLEREGGVVRFSAGRLLPYRINGQRLPRSLREYTFFLKRNQQGEDYHIVTAYEILRGRIIPLDESEQFQVFQGIEAEQFFKTLQDAVSDPSRRKGGTNK